MDTISFYNAKSRKTVKVEMSQVEIVMLNNGRPAAAAIDPETGVKMFKILTSAEYDLAVSYQKQGR